MAKAAGEIRTSAEIKRDFTNPPEYAMQVAIARTQDTTQLPKHGW